MAKVRPKNYQQPKNITTSPSVLNDTLEAAFYLYDHLGNARVVYTPKIQCPAFMEYSIDYVGDYYPYGKMLRQYTNGPTEKYLTTQHERDIETGLDYRGARFYDSDIARFLSLDPLAADYPSLSDYSYVACNPIIFIDPNGKEIIWADNRRTRRLKKQITRLASKNQFYAAILQYVDESNIKFIIDAGETAKTFIAMEESRTADKIGVDPSQVHIGGMVHSGRIFFKSMDSRTIFEESFHAYQLIFESAVEEQNNWRINNDVSKEAEVRFVLSIFAPELLNEEEKQFLQTGVITDVEQFQNTITNPETGYDVFMHFAKAFGQFYLQKYGPSHNYAGIPTDLGPISTISIINTQLNQSSYPSSGEGGTYFDDIEIEKQMEYQEIRFENE